MTIDWNVKAYSKGRMSARQRQAYHRQTEAIRLTAQRGMRANLKRVFKAQENAILALDDPTMDDVYTVILTSVPAFQLIFESTYTQVANRMYPLLDSTQNVKAWYALFETKAKRKETPPTPYEAAMKQWIRNECGEKIAWINQTTLDQVKDIYEASDNQIDFRNNISELFDDEITPYRSNAIARTETACATNRASVETMRSLDFKGRKSWMSVGDADVRDTHAHIDGMTVDFDGWFEWTSKEGMHVKMECPLDHKWSPPASEVVNCRCDVIFEL